MKEILCGYRIAGKRPKGEYLIKVKAYMLRIDFDNGATCSLLDNAGAHYPEQPLSSLNWWRVLSKSYCNGQVINMR